MNLSKIKNWIVDYLYNVGMALDCFLNAVLGGLHNEQISLRAAKAAKAEKDKKKWACYFCKFLHWVEHNHCEKTLQNIATGAAAGFRFLLLLAALFCLLFYGLVPLIVNLIFGY